MLRQNINCPETSSAGRLFDAVSALIGICPLASYHAEPPMRLDSVAVSDSKEFYPFNFDKDSISFKPTFMEILNDFSKQVEVGVISTQFHNTIVQAILKVVSEISGKSGLKKIALSGGSFQNKILLTKAESKLQEAGFEVFSHTLVPSNDGGIALGQLAIAAKRNSLNKLT